MIGLIRLGTFTETKWVLFVFYRHLFYGPRAEEKMNDPALISYFILVFVPTVERLDTELNGRGNIKEKIVQKRIDQI